MKFWSIARYEYIVMQKKLKENYLNHNSSDKQMSYMLCK